MKRSNVFWALVAANVLLAVAFVWRMIPDTAAVAQVHRAGDYIMMPANMSGVNNGVVFIVDTSNGLLAAAVYDENGKSIARAMLPMDLNRVFSGGGAVKPK